MQPHARNISKCGEAVHVFKPNMHVGFIVDETSCHRL